MADLANLSSVDETLTGQGSFTYFEAQIDLWNIHRPEIDIIPPTPEEPPPVDDVVAPILYQAVPQTSNKVLVIYSEPVVEAEASLASNYSFDNGLVAYSVERVADTQYMVTTSTMTTAVVYTVTVSGVHDLAGNLI